MNLKLWKFHGGLHLKGNKEISMSEAVVQAAIPDELVLPLQQHIGEPAKPAVKTGDTVLKGQLIAEFNNHIGSPVHASSSGVVTAIEDRPVPHSSGISAPCIIIKTDGKDDAIEYIEHDHKKMETDQLRKLLRDAGIVGLGGAGFPTFIKLNPGEEYAVNTLILNGAECEPYITCDAMLMQEQARKIIDGLLIMKHALQAKHCIIAIEDNKRIAHTQLLNALLDHEADFIDIVQVPTLYPMGGEKQLIHVLTGKEIPANTRPLHVGVICHNVATAAAVADAMRGIPLISRIVTVTGNALTHPRNLEVRLGTPFKQLLDECGFDRKAQSNILMGGPLMGTHINNDAIPVIKTTNCILVLKPEQTNPVAMPCIRCGDCASVCPVNLLPQQLYWYSRARDFDHVQDYNLFDCIECGCCAYICPSKIPLVSYYRFAKTEIWTQERDKQKSDHARERHEFRQLRMERKKEEDEARKRKKKELLKKTSGASNDKDSKKAVIEAAMARVKAKQAQQEQTKQNTGNLTEAQKQAIREVEERRKKSETKPSDPSSNSDTH